MITRRGSHRDRTEGQVLVLVAGGFIAFVAIVGLVVDGGVAFLNRRDGQNAADLASLAGARMITEHYMSGTTRTTDQVHDAVAASLVSNNCIASGGTPCAFTATYVASTSTGSTLRTTPVTDGSATTVPTGTIGVAVDVQRTPRTFFSSMLGIGSWSVETTATATTTRFSSVPPNVLLPIAICGWQSTTNPNDCSRATGAGDVIDWNPGQIYDLTDGVDAPGGFGYLSWSGANSAGELSNSLHQSNNPGFSLDSPYDDPGTKGVIGTNPANGETWFPVDTGKSNKGDVRAELAQWVRHGQEVLIPIYDIIDGTGNTAWYHITGVAAFTIMSQEQPAVDNIQAMFVSYFTLSDVPGGQQLPPTPADTTINIRIVK
jgi:Flp pilus assembly protein TadG